jgi:hypothetical protein
MKKLSCFIILGAIVTACCWTQPKTSIQEKSEIIMVNDTCINDTSAFRWFENDSTYTFCVANSDKTIVGIGYNAYDKDIVSDSLSAVLIAKAAWYPLYGKEKIEKEKPFRVTEYKKYWTVAGSLPDGYFGGTAHIVIRKSDGKVMLVWHEK